MLLVRQSHEIMNLDGGRALEIIESAGRTCYKSEAKAGPGTAEKMARGLVSKRHLSVVEHATATVRFVTNRGVTHEMVRHRLASYSQESTRYCDYGGPHIRFILPIWLENQLADFVGLPILDKRMIPPLDGQFIGARIWVSSMLRDEADYKELRGINWPPEKAREVLPNSLKTEIVMTCNLREWRHVLALRAVGTTGKPHPQMQGLMLPLLVEMKDRVPVIFDGLYEDARSRGLIMDKVF